MYEELTIRAFHDGLRAGRMTCAGLTEWYLDRIATVDAAEGGLNSVVTVNPNARADAEAADAAYAAGGDGQLPPLFGVPVLVKDQALTDGIRTTFGSALFADFVPGEDAEVIRRLRAAGAIILGKTAMCDFAAGWFSSSSMTGHTRSAYDPDRDSGGSSAGSGTAVAANLCLAAIGEDTGGSIRIPASFNNCYGLRVTTGLVPRTGFSPLVHFQDTPGPMARTVEDLALLLSVLVGHDPADRFTAIAAARPRHETYTPVTQDPARVWRVGVVEDAFGSDGDPDMAAVNTVIRDAVREMSQNGVDVVRGVRLPDLGEWIASTSVYTKVSPADITRFLSNLPGAPVSSFAEIYDQRAFHPENDLFHDIAGAPAEPDGDVEYLAARIRQGDFRLEVLRLFAETEVDFLIYPTVKVLPPTHADLAGGRFTCLTFPTNTVLASQAALPALSAPAGFSPDGLPVGLEIVARPLAEADLLRFAQKVESILHARRAPSPQAAASRS